MDALAPIINAISYGVLPLIFAMVLHEYAHGWVANHYGDPTARLAGRLTMNPLAHIDRVGTIIVPLLCFIMQTGFLFGWAKPVPINMRQLRNPRRDMALVAAAGPAMNLALAILSTLVLSVIVSADSFHTATGGMGGEKDLVDMILVPLTAMCVVSISINIVLMVFNLIPVPPLDGGRILTSLLPPASALTLSRVEPYGMFVILGILMIEPQVGVISTIIGSVRHFLLATVLPEQIF
ncbi:MAG: site-2 protease family protein [Nitrospirales bacterium]|nr:site-2 protease family protein [Nitrospira sp.]MDR4500237.1 site-2 protease family protein [Nitrospirales bacterium]